MNAEAANGTILDRSVVGAVLATPGGADWEITGGEARRCCLLRRQRRRKTRSRRITAKPATPPTTPPTTARVSTVLPPPDPAPELAVEEGAEPVLPGPVLPPKPPTAPLVVGEEVLDALDRPWVEEADADEKTVCEIEGVPVVEVTREVALRLEFIVDVKEALLAKDGRDLVEVTSVLFALVLEKTGLRDIGPVVVLAAERVGEVVVNVELPFDGAGTLGALDDCVAEALV